MAKRDLINLDNLSFEQAIDEIYPEVAPPIEVAKYPSNTFYWDVASTVRVAFIHDVIYSDYTQIRRPITARELVRWGISEAKFLETMSLEGCVVPLRQWNRVGRCGTVYENPSAERTWTPMLLHTVDLDPLGLRGLPLIMIPDPDYVLITGDRDWWGIRSMLRECLEITSDPITTRPLRLNHGTWETFRDEINPARRAFQRRFGSNR